MSRGEIINGDEGAAAVEFALILSILILLVVGIIQFALLFNAQITLNHATREGVRVYAITGDAVAGEDAAKAQATSLDPALISFSTTPCDTGLPTELAAEYPWTIRIPFFSITNLTLSATGVMRCGG